MITFCIDAGTRLNAGGAVFYRAALVGGCLADGADPRSIEALEHMARKAERDHGYSVGRAPRDTVLEVPRVYPGTKAAADPNDLIRLAVAGGRMAQALFAAALPPTTENAVQCVNPSDWKAQTDPDIMCERVLARLDDAERAVLEKVFAAHGKKGMPKSLRHNVIDAVGMGLWHLGRVRPGGAGR